MIFNSPSLQLAADFLILCTCHILLPWQGEKEFLS